MTRLDKNLEQNLNGPQLEAVTTLDGPLLIIAGAGSGKTRVITYRIAHLLSSGVHQSEILALTFTNKAAREMGERVRKLTQKKMRELTASTFHAFGVMLLREQISRIGYRSNFSIYDQVDKTELIREVARALSISRETLDVPKIASLFSDVKTDRVIWNDANRVHEPLYDEYQKHLQAYNAVDFDDLIMLPIRLLEEYPEALAEYRKRFRFIMVDEFQDTSLAQYRIMKLLGETHRNVCAVGDDDQSIYSWRGANYENIVFFERDFPERKEIKLDQNYRSTKRILEAANGLISHNLDRKPKELWTGSAEGKAVELFFPESESEEGRFIAETIAAMTVRDGVRYHNFGILVRTNGLTASIEEGLLADNIPYKVSGGTSFFQRKEVKDIIAYLRVLANPEDDVNLLRIINTPRRGLGRRTIEQIREVADKRGSSFYSAIDALRHAGDGPLAPKVVAELDEFLSLIEEYRERMLSGKKIAESVTALVDAVDYWGQLIVDYQKDDKIARWKFGNITRFIQMIDRWEKDPDTADPGLYSFLNRITLITRDDDDESEEGKVNLMTIHAAKGLEFDIVFLAGVEKGIIPHARAVEEGNLEEERRLFYVAITRAKQKLFLTSCKRRRLLRDYVECESSPFIDELPPGLLEYHAPEEQVGSDEAKDYFAAIKARLQ